MAVITVSEEFGAGADILARDVADQMGYKLADRWVFEEVLKEYGIVNFKEILDMPPRIFDSRAKEKRSAADILNSMYLLFAKKNNMVINSRRAFVVLAPFVNVMNVFLKAPISIRVQRVMDTLQAEQGAAVARIKTEEDARMKIIESFYNKRWDSLELWDLVIDTHLLGLDLARRIVMEACTQVAKYDGLFGWQDGSPTIDTIEVDPIMESVVDRILQEKQPVKR
jgi:cytidylate kinase